MQVIQVLTNVLLWHWLIPFNFSPFLLLPDPDHIQVLTNVLLCQQDNARIVTWYKQTEAEADIEDLKLFTQTFDTQRLRIPIDTYKPVYWISWNVFSLVLRLQLEKSTGEGTWKFVPASFTLPLWTKQ